MSPQRKIGLRRLAIVVGVLVVVVGCLAIWVLTRNGDVSNPDVEFKPPPKPTIAAATPETFVWPMYGYDRARTRSLNVPLHPPFRVLWRYNAHQLLEFSPILVRGTLYFSRKDATAFAINAKTGKLKWRKRLGRLSASSPAYARGRVFFVTLTGRIVCLDADNGHKLWSRSVGSRTESSPLVVGDAVYFGAESGTLYKLLQRNGRIDWTYRANGAIKGAPAYADGKVFVGTYGGSVFAVAAGSGRQVWSAGTSGAHFGLSSGNFYATPAVAFGRVYVGNTDGKVYSFAASSGALGWTKSTGNYVYAAAATDNVPGVGPTVFVGSYNGQFYALNARSGGVRWSYASGGQISGAPSVIGRVVYFSTNNTTNTYGLDTRSGHRVFFSDNGAYNPMIADGKRLYFTAYTAIAALVPRRHYRAQRRDMLASLRTQRHRR